MLYTIGYRRLGIIPLYICILIILIKIYYVDRGEYIHPYVDAHVINNSVH